MRPPPSLSPSSSTSSSISLLQLLLLVDIKDKKNSYRSLVQLILSTAAIQVNHRTFKEAPTGCHVHPSLKSACHVKGCTTKNLETLKDLNFGWWDNQRRNIRETVLTHSLGRTAEFNKCSTFHQTAGQVFIKWQVNFSSNGRSAFHQKAGQPFIKWQVSFSPRQHHTTHCIRSCQSNSWHRNCLEKNTISNLEIKWGINPFARQAV